MRRFIALVSLCAALATTGCAHKQLTNQQAAKYAVVGGTAVLAVGLTLYFGYRQTVDPPADTYHPQ
jgi:hypothetical protein